MIRVSARNSSSTISGARPFERLVEQQQARVEHQRAADREHLLLAARQLRAEVRRGAPRAAGTSRRRAPASTAPAARPAVRFSSTVSDLKMLRSCGTQPMPAATRWSGRSPRSRGRRTRSIPARWRVTPTSVVSSVVLPVPLRPSSASDSTLAEREADVVDDDRLAVAGAQALARAAGQAWLASPEIDGLDLRIAGDLVGRALDEQRAVDQHRDARGEAEHEIHVVLDQQHGDVGGQRRERVEDLAATRSPARRPPARRAAARAAGSPAQSRSRAAGACRRGASRTLRCMTSDRCNCAAARLPRPPRMSRVPARAATSAPRPLALRDTRAAASRSGVSASNSWLIWNVRTSPRRARS